jgi:Spy/CpxP family protein refolding chaperone
MKALIRFALAGALLGFGVLAQAQHGPDMDAPFGLIAHARGQLNLNTSQQLQWDNAVAQSKAAHDGMKASFDQVHSTLQAELAKSEPDLAAVSAAADSARQQNEGKRQAARSAWLALYATFTPEQKAVVRDTLRNGMAHMEARREAHAHHTN